LIKQLFYRAYKQMIFCEVESSFLCSMLLTRFVCGLSYAGESSKGLRQDIKCGAPFEPVQVYKMLQAIDYQAFKVVVSLSFSLLFNDAALTQHNKDCSSLLHV
jgi:hypothetical protein